MSERGHLGMTVNERLLLAGLFDEFAAAARERDRDGMIAILVRAELPRDAAVATTDAVLADPKRYGYGPSAAGQ